MNGLYFILAHGLDPGLNEFDIVFPRSLFDFPDNASLYLTNPDQLEPQYELLDHLFRPEYNFLLISRYNSL